MEFNRLNDFLMLEQLKSTVLKTTNCYYLSFKITWDGNFL